MTKTYTFQFQKDKVVHFEVIGTSQNLEKVIIEAARNCGAKVDENRLNGEERTIKIRCTSEEQKTIIILKLSSYMVV